MFQHTMFRQGQRQPEAILRPYTVKLLLALCQSNFFCLIYLENITFSITLEMAMITRGVEHNSPICMYICLVLQIIIVIGFKPVSVD